MKTNGAPADFAGLLARAEHLLQRVEALLPPTIPDPDWKLVTAARWRKRSGRGYLEAVAHPHLIALDELVAIDAQKTAMDRNTRQFVHGVPGEQRAADRRTRALASRRW